MAKEPDNFPDAEIDQLRGDLQEATAKIAALQESVQLLREQQALAAATARINSGQSVERGRQTAPIPTMQDLQDLASQIARLRAQAENDQWGTPGPLLTGYFPARLTGTDGWQQRCAMSGGLIDMQEGLKNAGGGGTAAAPLPGVLMLQLHDPQNAAYRYFYLSNTFKARITNATSSFPIWTYTVQRVIGYNSSLTGQARWVTDGVNLTAINRTEFAGTAPYTYGTGSTITDATTGEVNSSACLIIPIGIGAVVDVSIDVDLNDGSTLVYSFSAMNSAES